MINLSCFSRDLEDFDKFWVVLCRLESNNNPKAIGDHGLSIGIAQISKKYFLDAQKYDKNLLQYAYNDCFKETISKIVVRSYLSKYSKTDDFEEWARLHNSGPNWKSKKELTNKYWKKFLALSK